MIPPQHIFILALLQFTVGLLGLLLRRSGMVVLVSAAVMLNAVLLLFCIPGTAVAESPAVGVVVLVLLVALALTGAAILYSFHRFRRTVSVDEHDQMRH